MDQVLLNQVPRKCPECDTYMFTAAPTPKIGKKAWMVVAAGAVATAIWLTIFFLVSPFYIAPRGLGGIVLCALVYGWPLYVAALIAWKMPLVVQARCFKCKWNHQYIIGMPKI